MICEYGLRDDAGVEHIAELWLEAAGSIVVTMASQWPYMVQSYDGMILHGFDCLLWISERTEAIDGRMTVSFVVVG